MLTRRALVAALLPTVRRARLASAVVTVVLGAAPLVVASRVSGASLTVPSVVAGLVAGAALGWAADDPAAELLAAAPISAPVRTTVRVLGVVAVSSVVTAVVLVLVALGPGLPLGLGDRSLEAAAAGAVALAVGLALLRRGDPQPGVLAVATGLLVPVVVVALAVRWADVLPTFVGGPRHGRWAVVALVGLVVALRSGRDAARP